MVKIFSVGSPNVDYVIPTDGNTRLENLATSLCPKRGGKVRVRDYNEFDAIRQEVGHIDRDMTFPGGSASNTLIAMSKLLGDQFSATLFTVLGNDDKSQFLRNQFYRNGITLAPGSAEINNSTQVLKPAESLVFLSADGDRKIINYPGNIATHMQGVELKPNLVREADAVMLFGTVRETFGTKIFDDILKVRWGDHVSPKMHTQALWFSLPTNNEYSADNRDYFKWLAPSCNIVVGNETEIATFADTVGENLPISRISSGMGVASTVLNGSRFSRNGHLNHKPMSFMTEGSVGATVVQHEFGRVSVRPAKIEKPANSLAAGDVTAGTFYAAISVGMNPAAAAQLAMSAGAITVEYKGTVPPDLAHQLAVRDPENFKVFSDQLAKLRSVREVY